MKNMFSRSDLEQKMVAYASGANIFVGLSECLLGLALAGETLTLITREDSDGISQKHKFLCAEDVTGERYVLAYTSAEKVIKEEYFYTVEVPITLLFEFVQSPKCQIKYFP